MDTFAYNLRRFAHTVDYVDDAVVREIRTVLETYLYNALKAERVDIMRETTVDDAPGLAAEWSSESSTHQIRDTNGAYTCQMAQAYDCDTPLWVIAPDHGPLGEADKCVDQWSEVTDLPAYKTRNAGLRARTSVTLPLRVGAQKVGALCVESEEARDITPVAKQELELAVEALTILYLSYQATTKSREQRDRAMKELQQIIPEDPGWGVPHVFVASSSQADARVVETLVEALGREEFRGSFTSNHWQTNEQPGPVPQHIVQDIRKAKFGICYLSEPAEGDGEVEYRDNLNVLFEAGMFHALREATESEGWIPVRERNSPPPIFDIQSERHILVPRTEDGSLDRPELEETLCGHIRQLVGDRDQGRLS